MEKSNKSTGGETADGGGVPRARAASAGLAVEAGGWKPAEADFRRDNPAAGAGAGDAAAGAGAADTGGGAVVARPTVPPNSMAAILSFSALCAANTGSSCAYQYVRGGGGGGGREWASRC